VPTIDFFIPSGAHIRIDEIRVVGDVLDGDTVILDDGFTHVRLIGIDAPEMDEPYYEESTTKLVALCHGRSVALETDIEDKDMYERLLRYIYVDDKFINWEMVRSGLAYASPFGANIKYSGIIQEAENAAIREGLGVWE
jgi:micrococcal nuclease